jgi:CheY-like chemotaxis protein/HPt (histidine-containing phosphotransfer) domain-containing protein
MIASQQPGIPKQVLVAEDNRINQKILKELIRKEGMNATVVANGKEVLALLQQQAFDLIILDFHMPELNGLETMKAIRSYPDERIQTMNVVLFSSEQDKQHLADIQAYGIKYLLQKPVNQAEFSQMLQKIINVSPAHAVSQPQSSLTYLREITSGNTELLIELIDIFMDEVPDAIKKIKMYYQLDDWSSLQTLAHKLRSNYKYVGSQEGDQYLKLLEDKISSEENQSYDTIIENLQKLTSRIVESLQKEKDTNRNNSQIN